jgi:hypothetical protein
LVAANQGKRSRGLAKEIPALLDTGVWDAISEAVKEAFGD